MCFGQTNAFGATVEKTSPGIMKIREINYLVANVSDWHLILLDPVVGTTVGKWNATFAELQLKKDFLNGVLNFG